MTEEERMPTASGAFAPRTSTKGLNMLEINKIYNMDCIEGMKLIDDNSIDLIVTSPPYDNLRNYKGFSFNFERTAKELYRVIKKGGVVVWVVGDATIEGSETGTSFKQVLYFKEIGFNLHDTMIYQKNPYVPLNHNRYEQEFEYMFILSKGKPNEFNPIYIPCIEAGKTKSFSYNCGTTKENSSMRSGMDRVVKIKDTKIKGNIWKIGVGKGRSAKDNIAFEHPAIFPEQLAKDHITSWSNKGDIILDPFMGSGTTAVACKELQRNFIGFEISKEYCDIAEQRLEKWKGQTRLGDKDE
jgi:site-specific DNA-methyltransferase (adenine-specific)